MWYLISSHLREEKTITTHSVLCLENATDGGVWWAAVHGVAESRTRLNDFTSTFHFPALEKEMAVHSSVLAWRIPGTGEPGGRPSMGSHRVRHDWSDLAAAAALKRMVIPCTLVAPLYTETIFHLRQNNQNSKYSLSLENSMDRGAWWATVFVVTKSDTTEWLSLYFTYFLSFPCLPTQWSFPLLTAPT